MTDSNSSDNEIDSYYISVSIGLFLTNGIDLGLYTLTLKYASKHHNIIEGELVVLSRGIGSLILVIGAILYGADYTQIYPAALVTNNFWICISGSLQYIGWCFLGKAINLGKAQLTQLFGGAYPFAQIL